MYELLKRKAIEEKDQELKKELNYLREDNNYLLERELTQLRIDQLKSGEITKEKAIEIASKKIVKTNKKEQENKLKHIADVEKAKDINYITIMVEWKSNRTWGANPSAIVRTSEGTTTGTASGCGYDKESAAIAEAFNKNKSILKLIYERKEQALKDNYNISSHEAIGYGSGYGAVPYYEGGVGTSCFESILKDLGFKCSIVWGKNSTSYNFYK